MYERDITQDLMGLPTLDPTVAAYKRFIEKNKGQAKDIYQFLSSEQGRQLDPKLAGAMISLDKLQKAASQPPGQMPQSTVVDDVAQQAGLMAARNQAIAQRQMIPREAGLRAAMPMSAQAPQQMAGGGMVAFEDGGFITAPKSMPSNPQNPLDDYRPDPRVQRQIQEEAGLGGMSEADKFRFYGMPMDQAQRPSDSEMFGSALRNVMTDPAALGAGLGAIVGGPIGIPIGGYLGRTVGQVVGKAGGGPIAFDKGGDTSTSIDTTRVRPYQFTDDLQAQIPSFMRDDTDIVTFVKAQMPNFDTLSMADKQSVLKQFEPAYNRARAAQQQLRDRKAESPSGVPAVAAPPPQTVDMRGQMAQRTPDSGFAFENPLRPNQPVQDAFEALSTPAAPAAPSVQRTAPAARKPAPAAAAAKSPLDELSAMVGEKPDLAAIRAEREERQKKQKTGAYSQADADLAAFIKEQKDKGGDEKTAYKNFWIMTGASLLGNRSPFFTQALGDSIKENYGGLVKDLKQIKDDTKTLRLQEIQLQRSKEQMLESGDEKDRDTYERRLNNYQDKLFQVDKLKVDIHEKALDRANDRTLAQLRQYGNDRLADQLMREWDATQKLTGPEKQAAITAYENRLAQANRIISQTTASAVSANIRQDTAIDVQIARQLKDDRVYNRALRDSQNPDLKQKDRDDAINTMRVREQQVRGLLGAGPRQLTPGDNLYQSPNVSGGPYSTSGW